MRRFIAATLLAAAVLSPGGPAAAAPPLAITRESQRDLMVTIYNGNLGLVKDTREARLPAGMSEVQFADVAAQIDPDLGPPQVPDRPRGLRSSSRTTSTTSSRARSSWRSTSGRRSASTRATARSRGDASSRPTGRSSTSTARSTWATRARSCFPRCRRTSCRSPRCSGCSATRDGGPAGRGVVPDRRHHLEGRLRHPDTRPTPRRPHGWVTIDNKSGATYRDAALKLVAGDFNRAARAATTAARATRRR